MVSTSDVVFDYPVMAIQDCFCTLDIILTIVDFCGLSHKIGQIIEV